MRFDRDGFYKKDKGAFMTLGEYLVRDWGRDAGHSLNGVVLTVVAWAILPDQPYWAALIGGTVYMLPKELIDFKTWHLKRMSLDKVSDAVSYQSGWPLVVTLSVGLGWGALVLGGIAALYLGLVWLKLKP